MVIRSVHVRRFRSIEAAALTECGGLNTLIGKNNAGKSNLLAAIELVLLHLKTGRLAAPWRTRRPAEEFNNRDTSTPLRIGIEFEMPAEMNAGLRQRLTKEAPNLERSIEQIGGYKSVAVIVAAAIDAATPYLFVEQLAVGALRAHGEDLLIDGTKLLSVTRSVALELCQNVQSADSLLRSIEFLEGIRSERSIPLRYVFDTAQENRSRVLASLMRGPIDSVLYPQVEARIGTASNIDEFKSSLSDLMSETKTKVEALEKKETAGAISAYAGDTKVPPPYALWLLKEFGNVAVLHLREMKRPIGREEARTLLDMKITRGGPQRLLTIQETVRGLMGVNLDAFQASSKEENAAEMDIDEFLVEANGAGIKEALRVILDLELRNPSLALIEEPEVHLHPGLARVLATYLREKSNTIQIFVTTHSTDFVDFVPFQSVFLISRDPYNKTVCEAIGRDDAAVRIPAELGLRLSTVFMFERLVFVEGPSDEGVFREFARRLNLDFTKSNVGFVYMKGTRNFAHFAAEATLELLSRRRVRMWFILDRDENEDEEILRMAQRLRDQAALRVLEKREIENYLLDPRSLAFYIDEKLTASGSSSRRPTAQEIAAVIQQTAEELRDEVTRLRMEKRLLTPVFLHTRAVAGSIKERIQAAAATLQRRLDRIEEDERFVSEQIAAGWPENASNVVPGSLILEKLARHFGSSFSKAKGDSERLAHYFRAEDVAPELTHLLEEFTR